MFEVLMMLLVGFVGVPPQADVLPSTPQGKHVAAYIEAFNTGDQKKYLAMMETHVDPALLKKRSVEERAQMFERMRSDFGTLKVAKVIKASAEQIDLAIPNTEGTEATFSFKFESAAPHRISAISVEIDRGPR